MDNIKYKPLGAILLATGLILGAHTLHKARQDGAFFEERVSEGKVADRYTTGRDANGPRPALRVVYIDESNRQVELRQEVDDAFWDSHPAGSPVQVRHTPGRPEKASIVGATAARIVLLSKLVGGAVLVLLGIGVLLYDRIRT